jgi:hypothetical protein
MFNVKKCILIDPNQYLTHHWPISNCNMSDAVGTSHMSQGNFTNFTADRFGNLSSALALNGGWTKTPQGIYFSPPEFSISVWILPQEIGSGFVRILDFGNGPSSDNIILALTTGNSLRSPYLGIYSNTSETIKAYSSLNLTEYQWQFLATTFNGTNARVYLNGELIADQFHHVCLPTLSRNNCYIGKSNWPGDGYSHSYLDDLKFYNKSLTQEEIVWLMYQNETCKYMEFILKRMEIFCHKSIFFLILIQIQILYQIVLR